MLAQHCVSRPFRRRERSASSPLGRRQPSLMDPATEYLREIQRIAGDVAAGAATAVDRESRFPIEAFDALKASGALSAAVPESLGGGGLPLEAIARSCLELGRRCSATGMIFAMHQIQVFCIARHLGDSSWFEDYLRSVASEQRLIASATSEIGTGGDMSRSIAAVSPGENGMLTFEKQAPTVSYGAQADDLLTTLRRSPDGEPGDQVLVLSTKTQTQLEPAGVWDTLGMRGTCSPGFLVKASVLPEQILPTPFAKAMNESMVPISHILWSHVWLGIAVDAFDRARAFVREAARRSAGQPLPAAQRLSSVMSELGLLRAEVARALSDYVLLADEAHRERLSTMATVLRFNNLKIAASEQAVRVCRGALDVVGVAGYRNDTPYSVGRHLRDVLSAPIMVANERILATDAALLLIAKEV
jgi:acyl-CoA dehydrogenase